MKKIILLFAAITITSCSVDSIEENEEIHQEIESKSTALASIDQLEDTMQWLSFLTVEVLATNQQARNEFQSLYSVYGNVIPVDVLIGEDSQATAFNLQLRYLLSSYIIDVYGGPNGADGRPQGRPSGLMVGVFGPPPIGPGSGFYIPLIEDFIDSVTVENCLELYLPQPIHLSSNATYHSTAHPLNNAPLNNGQKLYYSSRSSLVPTLTYNDMIMSNNSIQLTFNVFVARPYRTQNTRSCQYTSIPVQDFTLFLD